MNMNTVRKWSKMCFGRYFSFALSLSSSRPFVSLRASPLFSLLAICSILMRLLLALPLSVASAPRSVPADVASVGDVNFTVFRRTRPQSIGERAKS